MQIKKSYLILFWIFFGALGRLIPHPPNMTPLLSLSLFAGRTLSKKLAIISIAISLIFSDLVLHFLFGYPIFGSWSIFTYTGFILITLSASQLQENFSIRKLILYTLLSSLGFWLWTNFGVWLATNIYSKNLLGLINCYTMALPFLRNQLLGDLGWIGIIFYGFKFFRIQSSRLIAHTTSPNNFYN